MNVIDQTPMTVFLMVVLGLAAVSTAAAVGVMAEAAMRTWRNHRPPAHPELHSDRFERGVRPGSPVVFVSADAQPGSARAGTEFAPREAPSDGDRLDHGLADGGQATSLRTRASRS